MAGTMPSTLHQKVKFMVEESLITVVAEEDMIATTTVKAPYLEIKEDASQCSFRSFEIATATKEETEARMSHLSQNTQMILRQTVGKGAKTGHGLGKNLQGKQIVLSSIPKRNRHGVGYQLHNQGRNGRIQKENRRTRPYLAFPPLNWTFRSRGYINASLSKEDEGVIMPFLALTISVITEDKEELKMPIQLFTHAHRTLS